MDNANPIDQDSDHEEAFQTWKSNMQEGAEECRREDTARREIINEMRQHKRNEPVMQHRLHNAKQSINDQLHRKGQRLLSPSPGPPAQSATEAAVDRANSGVQIRGVDPTSGTATWFVLDMPIRLKSNTMVTTTVKEGGSEALGSMEESELDDVS